METAFISLLLASYVQAMPTVPKDTPNEIDLAHRDAEV